MCENSGLCVHRGMARPLLHILAGSHTGGRTMRPFRTIRPFRVETRLFKGRWRHQANYDTLERAEAAAAFWRTQRSAVDNITQFEARIIQPPDMPTPTPMKDIATI